MSLSAPSRVATIDAPSNDAQQVAEFTCWRSSDNAPEGYSRVWRVPLTEPDTGQKVLDGYIIRWYNGSSGVWEQNTLNGQLALKEAANKFGWGL